MRKRRDALAPVATCLGLVVLLAVGLVACPADSAAMSVGRSPVALATEAYVWGLPLVVSTRTAQTFARALGVNRLYDQPDLSAPASRTIIEPNADTLYSVAVLDLRAGPQVLKVPVVHDRYYSFEFLDMYTRAFAYLGTRATDGRAGTWVIAGPQWTGVAPAGDTVVRASTPVVVMIGRFLVDGSADVPAVRQQMAGVQLQPLSGSGGGAGGVADHADSLGAPAGPPADAQAAGPNFFDELGDDLSLDPPRRRADLVELSRFAALGIGAGLHPGDGGSPATSAVLARGVTAGAAEVRRAVDSDARAVNGWSINLHAGRYGHDFLLRAAVAQTGWGANVPQEAVYATSRADSAGATYDGTGRYELVFPPGRQPPVRAFWSVTVYGPDGFFVANATDRYAIGSDTPGLRRDNHGRLVLYLQRAPRAGHQANWLPVPAGRFYLVLRMYLPDAAVLTGRYRLPPVRQLVGSAGS